MTIPGAVLRFVLTLAFFTIAPMAASAATISDGSHSFQRSDLQLMSVEGSGYYSFHLYSRFSPISDGIGDRRERLDQDLGLSNWPPLTPNPPVVEPPGPTEPPGLTEPPGPTEPPGLTEPPEPTEPPGLTEPPFVGEPPGQTSPLEVAELPTLLMFGTGLLAAASAGRRRRH